MAEQRTRSTATVFPGASENIQDGRSLARWLVGFHGRRSVIRSLFAAVDGSKDTPSGPPRVVRPSLGRQIPSTVDCTQQLDRYGGCS